MRIRNLSITLSFSALALVLVACGGGGSGGGSGTTGSTTTTGGSGSTGGTTTGGSSSGAPTTTLSYTVNSDDQLGIGPDANDLFAAMDRTKTTASTFVYYSASGPQTINLPSGYTLGYPDRLSGGYAFLDVIDSNDIRGLLMMNLAKGGSVFEADRTIEAWDGTRIVTGTFETETAPFKIETLRSDTGGIAGTKDLVLPDGTYVDFLAGDYVLTQADSTRGTKRTRTNRRLVARDSPQTYSLYTTSGTKVCDYAALTGTTVFEVRRVNAKGQAVGSLEGTLNGVTGIFGVSWDKTGKPTLLPGDAHNVFADGISDAGLILGVYVPNYDTDGDQSGDVVYLYRDGKRYTTTIPNGAGETGLTRSGKSIYTQIAPVGNEQVVTRFFTVK